MPAASPTALTMLARQTSLSVMPGVWRRDAAGERRPAAGVLPVRGLQDVAERRRSRAPARAARSSAARTACGAELDAGVDLGQRAPEAPDRRPGAGDEDRGCGVGSPAARIRRHMELLVIGAGPYGLAVAAEARRRGLSVTVVGEPMRFWRRNMPDGMLLRSGREWHLDAAGVHTFDAFVGGWDDEPIPVETFIAYADWFAEQEGSTPLLAAWTRLTEDLVAHLDDGSTIHADRVVAAPGIAPFAVEPALVTERLAPEQWSHTVGTVDFAGLAGRRVLILGGRQSAFEWAALLAEAGAERVDVVYRHDTPAFTESDWSFVDDLLAETRRTRGWFRGLPDAERTAIAQRFWQVGRLQLEPWLAPRIATRPPPPAHRDRGPQRQRRRSPPSSPTARASRPTTSSSPPATSPT